jgi:hypothetical protein
VGSIETNKEIYITRAKTIAQNILLGKGNDVLNDQQA